jgi:hypothetical protein
MTVLVKHIDTLTRVDKDNLAQINFIYFVEVQSIYNDRAPKADKLSLLNLNG